MTQADGSTPQKELTYGRMSRHQLCLVRVILLLLVACSLNERLVAQTKAASQLPEFEVATIKPVVPDVFHNVGLKVYPGGRVSISTFPLTTLIASAFRVPFWQISGAEAWMGKEEYDIDAKPQEALQSSIMDFRYTVFGVIEDEQLRAMLQRLLIDRFQLQFHRETKTGDIYFLERSGKTLGLKPKEIAPGSTSASASQNPAGSIGYAGARWAIISAGMPQLAAFASEYVLRAPVADRTGLTGLFDYRQESPDAEPNYSDNSDSFLRMLSDVGLRLQKSKGPVEVFVIDHAQRPSPN